MSCTQSHFAQGNKVMGILVTVAVGITFFIMIAYVFFTILVRAALLLTTRALALVFRQPRRTDDTLCYGRTAPCATSCQTTLPGQLH